MGFLSSIKKLFFTVESVSKSGAEKVKDSAMEMGSDAMDHAKDLGSKVADSASEYGSIAKDKVEDLVDQGKDKFDDLLESFAPNKNSIPREKTSYEKVQDEINRPAEPKISDEPEISDKPEIPTEPSAIEDIVSKVGSSSLDLGEKAMDKMKDISEGVGKTVIDKFESLSEGIGKDVLDKAQDLSEKIGSGLSTAKDHLTEKAKEAAEKMGDLMDETLIKAKELEKEEALKDKNKDGFADTDLDVGGSLLDDKGDFFAKAEKFAKGEFNKGKVTVTGKIEDKLIPAPDTPAFGFEDRDGDGDELIDDAVLEEE